MDKKKVIFFVLALCILAVPVYLMMSSEAVLEDGHRHKLRLEGRDPFDPFRGKYIRLNVDEMADCDGCQVGENAFVTLVKDEQGFSTFEKASGTKPSHDDYFIAEVLDNWEGGARLKIDNIEKYFINEDKAKPAEDVIWDYQANHPDDIYLAIRVLDGEIRLEDIFIKETPLLDFLADH